MPPPLTRIVLPLTALPYVVLTSTLTQVGFFDVSFTRGHKPLSFTTSPRARATHWKQTVFYLEDTLVGGEL